MSDLFAVSRKLDIYERNSNTGHIGVEKGIKRKS